MWEQPPAAGHEHDSFGNNCTSFGSTVPRTVKMPSFASREIEPFAITYAAHSATEAAQLPLAVDDSAPSVVTDEDADELAGDANDTGAESAADGPASNEDEN